ncbi:MAG: hypothetical protein JGK17_00335 [Microcoleus sp. PH2017_10_PVI_O_A]|uniref:hypothetical protein n=1 Tax=unclassified Microcoleus TaxID=2642155 RepID=UPI001E0AF704|nr:MULTISPECIES: hypothetical protein [unclassified Microcoleus]TAE85935.1 MAG: hypothetical protein EAZ83_00905 [Oscillatoriales cyanobacterium]MCC3404067.1 hypothetical protein [Microcoleus sp. PH2017_10_PVI_O_A]MCC3458150.1 hypothetical protein [Microcoleus sp. PH2017_11_PCY_U_A]MCC3476572.1 hypothetical protein [Microcoleus sp. PH2017_12_PCY_D_A]MCC3527088.1 hypothetical protein [Microcoleus sp. PH2017_21_RUC_O_A]
MTYFVEGNFIYECKSSPERADGSVNQGSLKNWICDVKKLLKRKQPTGFRYIFPVNRLDDNNKNILGKLKEEFPNVDIQYYDCDSVDRLVRALEKVNSLPELVEYIKQARN